MILWLHDWLILPSPLNRLLRPNRTVQNSIGNRVFQEEEEREHKNVKKPAGPLVSGAAYCFSSCSMILLNKVVLSTYNFNAGISLMFYQVWLVFDIVHIWCWYYLYEVFFSLNNLWLVVHSFTSKMKFWIHYCFLLNYIMVYWSICAKLLKKYHFFP